MYDKSTEKTTYKYIKTAQKLTTKNKTKTALFNNQEQNTHFNKQTKNVVNELKYQI